jgi:hypothetical protein
VLNSQQEETIKKLKMQTKDKDDQIKELAQALKYLSMQTN